ncbi:MAG: hypothetical protein ACYS9X_22475 [Planctomycetota bacterium]|jgi:hypothetical protein
METPVTPSEEVVYQLCRKTFLSLWSYANPLNSLGKELCDVLVVCDPDVVVFSVKETSFGNSGDPNIDHERWRRRAIEASVRQIYGAERWIKANRNVIKSDGQPGLVLPCRRRLHRVAVALGGEGKPFFNEGDFGRGYVHVLDENALLVALTEEIAS